jgi:hypothetical protein
MAVVAELRHWFSEFFCSFTAPFSMTVAAGSNGLMSRISKLPNVQGCEIPRIRIVLRITACLQQYQHIQQQLPLNRPNSPIILLHFLYNA